MIEANVIKGIQAVVGSAAADPKQEESLGEYVARVLHISEGQANEFLSALERGSTVEKAVVEADIDTSTVDHDMLTKIARAIGSTLAAAKKIAS